MPIKNYSHQNKIINYLIKKKLVLKNCGNIKKIGKIFDDHWKLKKKLSDKISNNYLDKFYTQLMKTKLFYGGKIIGAGGGGFYLMVTKNKKKTKNYLTKKKMHFINLKFDYEGSTILKNN